MTGKRVAGIVAIIIAILAGVADVLFYMHPHPRRWVAVIVVCGVLLILGIILVAVSGRTSTKAPVQ